MFGLMAFSLPNSPNKSLWKNCFVFFRLQHIIDLLENDSIVDKRDMIKNLKYSIAVLDTRYIEETKWVEEV